MNNDQLISWTQIAWNVISIGLSLVAAYWILSWLGVFYSIWEQKKMADLKIITAEKKGAADLAQAHNDQQVQVAQAKGRLDASQLNKQAEIIDAEAVAKSVEIIGKSLHENHGYLQWKWIHMMEETEASTIYVPTECNLPILEAGKRTDKA